jgi:hypothetical protein
VSDILDPAPGTTLDAAQLVWVSLRETQLLFPKVEKAVARNRNGTTLPSTAYDVAWWRRDLQQIRVVL